MKNIITVYKLNLPFLENSKYDSSKCNSIIEEIRKTMIYNEIFIMIKSKKEELFEITNLEFKTWYIRIIKFNNVDNYSLPSFQIDIFCDWNIGNEFLNDFFSIFNTSWLDEYIFDLISDELNIKKYKILTISILKNDFDYFSEKALEIFFKKVDKNYVDKYLEENKIIRNNLYYLIYLNYCLFKNISWNKEEIKKLEKIIWTNISDDLVSEFKLTQNRLLNLQGENIKVFEKYREMIYYFINLIYV